MCGRYQLDLPGHTLASMFDAQLGAGLNGVDGRTWNAAPTQHLPVLLLGSEGHRVLDAAQWGLIPHWGRAKDAPPRPLINARVETVAGKASFRNAVRRGRILVPTTGFYEWHGPRGDKTPYSIRVRDTDAFLLAGIAEEWTHADGRAELTYAVLTTEPNELMAGIHDRMPVILDGDAANAWLETPPQDVDRLFDIARIPFPAERMEAWPVSRDVNAAANDGPQLVDRVDPEPTSLF